MGTFKKEIFMAVMVACGLGTWAYACSPRTVATEQVRSENRGQVVAASVERTAETADAETGQADDAQAAPAAETGNEIETEIKNETGTEVEKAVSPETAVRDSSRESFCRKTCNLSCRATQAATPATPANNGDTVGKDESAEQAKPAPADATAGKDETPAPATTSPAATAPAPAEQPSGTASDSTCQTGSFSDQFLCLINAHRKTNGKAALAYDVLIGKAAEGHSAWMQSTGNFSHTGADGSRFYQRCEAAGTTCDAENIAYGFTSAQMLFSMWKNSPGHNANMLGDHSVMGLGIVGRFATNDFR